MCQWTFQEGSSTHSWGAQGSMAHSEVAGTWVWFWSFLCCPQHMSRGFNIGGEIGVKITMLPWTCAHMASCMMPIRHQHPSCCHKILWDGVLNKSCTHAWICMRMLDVYTSPHSKDGMDQSFSRWGRNCFSASFSPLEGHCFCQHHVHGDVEFQDSEICWIF